MTTQDHTEGRALWRLFRRMGPHARKHQRKLVLGTMAMIVVAVTEIIRPWPLKVVFDGLLMPQAQPDAVMSRLIGWFGTGDGLLTAASLAILTIAVVGGAMAYVQATMIAQVGQKLVADIRLDLYRHVQRLSHSFHDTASSADIIARLTGDVRMMRDLLIDAAVFFAARTLVIAGTIGIMLLMDWRLTLVALVVMPGLALVSHSYSGRIRQAARRQRKKEGKIAVVMTEGISAISVVKGFARESYEEERFARQNSSSAEAGVQSTRMAAQMDRIVQVMLAVGTCLVIWYGVVRVRAGAISPGDLLVFTAYLSTLYKPIRRMSAMSARVAKATASGERLLEIFDIQPDIADPPGALTEYTFAGRVSLDDVTFAYPGQKPVLEKATLTLEPGQIVALVGPSGAGKSSAAKLMMRFYDPQHGHVRFDDHDIRDINLASLRDLVSVVLQDTVLFATSIRDNIAYGRLDATDDEIRHAAVAAGADAFIRRLPEGYDTVVGERGETLSGGQRQRIAIARAILRDAPVLILDEPLTGLDASTAKDLVGTLRTVATGRTTLLIAHDPLSLTLADRLVWLHDRQFTEKPPLRNMERSS
ncbi:MAG: ABC transporter ATP-binding protein [Paracoccaceae bacterium]